MEPIKNTHHTHYRLTPSVYGVYFTNHASAEGGQMNSRDLLKMLEANGWYIHKVKGSHHQLKHPTKAGKVTLPHPKKDLPPKTVASILKQAGLE